LAVDRVKNVVEHFRVVFSFCLKELLLKKSATSLVLGKYRRVSQELFQVILLELLVSIKSLISGNQSKLFGDLRHRECQIHRILLRNLGRHYILLFFFLLRGIDLKRELLKLVFNKVNLLRLYGLYGLAGLLIDLFEKCLMLLLNSIDEVARVGPLGRLGFINGGL
jgi:hypothetical protein